MLSSLKSRRLSKDLARAEQEALDDALLVATVPNYGQFEETDAATRAHLVGKLIKQGANPDAVNVKNGNTPLCNAILRADEALIEQLLVSGATLEPSISNGHHTPPLHLAAWQGNTNIIDQLLHHGALVDHVDTTGKTALFSACLNDQINSMQLLVRAGASLSWKDGMGRTALECLALRSTIGEAKDDWRETIDMLIDLYPFALRKDALASALSTLTDPSRSTHDREVEKQIYRTSQYLQDLIDRLK